MVSGQIGPWSDTMVVSRSTMVNHGWQLKTMVKLLPGNDLQLSGRVAMEAAKKKRTAQQINHSTVVNNW